MAVWQQVKVRDCRLWLPPRMYADPVCDDSATEVAYAVKVKVTFIYIVSWHGIFIDKVMLIVAVLPSVEADIHLSRSVCAAAASFAGRRRILHHLHLLSNVHEYRSQLRH